MLPYTMQPQVIEATGGVTSCHEFDFPSRTFIRTIIIQQVSGGLEAFTAALFNHEGVCEGASESDSEGLVTGPIPPDNYRVTPDLVGAAGQLHYFAEQQGGSGYDFFSLDGANQRGSRLGNARKIYLRITPAGSGLKRYAITLGGCSAMM